MASSYPTIRYGSSGQEVRRLQQALNREGYSLDVDGGFGKKTLAALMDYQRRVGMTPDGVAGSKTWASLGVQSAQDRLADLEKGYTPSRETQDAKRSWEELAANRPEDYTSPYTERMEELLRERRHRLALLAGTLESYSPVKKLSGGYAFVEDGNHQALRSIHQIRKKDTVQIHLLDGTLTAAVTEIQAAEGVKNE